MFVYATVDTTPPKVEICPDTINDVVELGSINRIINWLKPEATDASGNVTLARQSHYPGDSFLLGETDVSYLFVDGAGNSAWCNFSISLSKGKINMLNKDNSLLCH